MQIEPLIFLIEDDAEDRETFSNAIDDLGIPAKIIYAENGRDALNQISSTEFEMPHMIFLDLNMPGVNGYEVLSYFRNQDAFNKIPVAILSTSMNTTIAEKCKNMGANECLRKPEKYQILMHELNTVVGRYIPYSPLR